MKITEVKIKEDRKNFLELPLMIYKNDDQWIRPLDKDIEQVFDPEQNKFFRQGKAIRWLLKDDDGKTIGRVAAFINERTSQKEEQPTGGMGFFECIDDQQAANRLFDTCKTWLQNQGMEAMDGPVNFGERDRWWGLLSEGFTSPLYCMNYNPSYYQNLFEKYGFKTYFNQICYSLDLKKRAHEKFYERYNRISEDKDYSARHILKNDLEKFAADFAVVYNKAWANHSGSKQMTKEQAMNLFRKMKPILDEDLAWYVYYKNEPIAFWFNLPDINQIVKHLDGKFDLFHKLKFLWLKKRGVCKRVIGLVFGIAPEFQGKGVDGYMIISGANVIQPSGKYNEMEMQWIGDFNPKMINIAESLETQRTRILKTYRYLFDRTKEFKRYPIIK
jgi:hypothetical protein